MIALDTSALLRYLLDDEAETATLVARVIEGQEPVGIPALVLLETAHVLRGRPYGRTNPDVADALVDLLAHESILLIGLDADLASAALRSVRDLSARHIADALIGASARDGGATGLLTADSRFVSDLISVRQLVEGWHPTAGQEHEPIAVRHEHGQPVADPLDARAASIHEDPGDVDEVVYWP